MTIFNLVSYGCSWRSTQPVPFSFLNIFAANIPTGVHLEAEEANIDKAQSWGITPDDLDLKMI